MEQYRYTDINKPIMTLDEFNNPSEYVMYLLEYGQIEHTYGPYVRINKHPHVPDLAILNYTSRTANEGSWDDVTTQARGLIINTRTGEIVAQPFPKFFNLGEEHGLQAQDIPNGPFRVYEKVDGSLGILYRTPDGNHHIATRGRFDSPQAKEGTTMLQEIPNHTQIPDEYTLMFEIVYRGDKKVVDYGDTRELVLLGGNNRFTGEELSWKIIEEMSTLLNIRTAKTYHFDSFEELMQTVPDLTADEEGYVVVFDTGQRVKIKGKAYIELHRAQNGMRAEEIIKHMIQGSIGERLAQLAEEHRPHYQQIVDELFEESNVFKARVETLVREARELYPDDEIDIKKVKKNRAQWIQQKINLEEPFANQIKSAFFALIDNKEKDGWWILGVTQNKDIK